MKPKCILIAGAALGLAVAGAQADTPRLADVFGDHMVLQRDVPARLFGTADPGAAFIVSLDGADSPVRAGRDGRWWVEFPALAMGEAHEISLSVDGEIVQSVEDVLAGDVFLCSGQSNMEYPMSRVTYVEREVAGAGHPHLRLLHVNRALSLTPESRLPEGSAWAVATPDTAAGFSAVCYYTGRALAEAHDVPVGLIASSWGGSRIESWIDGKVTGRAGDHAGQIALLDLYRSDRAAAADAYAESWQASWRADPAGAGAAVWEAPEAGDWTPVPGPLRDWRQWGDPALTDHLGMVWHKIGFDLTEAQARLGARLHIGAVDDTDMTWLNGTAIGTTFDWGGLRVYDVPAGLLRPGRNSVLVNAHNDYGDGGMNGPDTELRLELADGGQVSLAEGWMYRKVPAAMSSPKPAPWFTIKGYTMLHNAMIAPLDGLRLKGAVWYQGESNAGDGAAYESLLRLLVEDWRAKFGDGLPVAVVQLPRYGALPVAAGEPGWGVIRESMRRVAAGDPQIGLAVTIDRGDPADIHPPNKKAVAERVIRVMQALAYDAADAAASGPVARQAVQNGDAVRIQFDGLEEGLETVSAAMVMGLEACTGETCRFVPGRLDADAVIAETGPAPVDQIRYCQGDAPLCNLFDGNGLPAGPFWIPVD